MNPCPHSDLIFLGIQEFPGGKPLRLYNCVKCHTTVARHRYFLTEPEIQDRLQEIGALRVYLLNKDNPITPDKNFEALEALINEVSRARTPEFWR